MGLSLQGRRALVTGASGGIGIAIAKALHARGAHVVLTARRAELLESLTAELGDRAEVVVCDLADRAALEALPGQAGQVDVLVANAGLPGSGLYVDFEPDLIDKTIDVNLRAPMLLARELGPGMVERGAGALVFISSLSGKAASPRGALYSSTKFGLRGFALGLREDMVGTGVGVTTVFPGFIRDAGMFHESQTKLPPGVGTRTPEQVADAVVRGIEKDRAEIAVAPFALRAGAAMAGVAPSFMGALQRRLGSQKVAGQMAKGQAGKS
jgi:short-subunit dehydrogenase